LDRNCFYRNSIFLTPRPTGLLHIFHTCGNLNGEALTEGKYILLFTRKIMLFL
jgi:hypothetical protein